MRTAGLDAFGRTFSPLRRWGPYLIGIELVASVVLSGWLNSGDADAAVAAMTKWIPRLIAILACLAVAALFGRSRVAIAALAVGAAVAAATNVSAGVGVLEAAARPETVQSSDSLVAAGIAWAGCILAVWLAAAFAGAAPPAPRRPTSLLGALLTCATVIAATIGLAELASARLAGTIPITEPFTAAGTTVGRWPLAWLVLFALGTARAGASLAGEISEVERGIRVHDARPGLLPTLRRWWLAVGETIDPPSRSARAVEGERGALAADLHATVLPSLYRSLREAETGGSAERLAADLRDAVAEVEALLASRRSIVLEEMGLLPALEWLAERTEERTDLTIVIDVDGVSNDGRPPRPVERAAFRVAQLALENAARHAPGSSVAIDLIATPVAVGLEIEDDGPGLSVTPRVAVGQGRRGLADMRGEAERSGARLAVTSGRRDGRSGTRVTFTWP